MNKQCSKCKKIKPLNEFYKLRTGKYGVRADCKVCNRKSRKEYHKNHLTQKREYRKNNIERINKNLKEYYRNNLEKYKEYYKKNRIKIIELAVIRRKNNPEKVNKYNKGYRKNHPEKVKEFSLRGYRKRRLNIKFKLSDLISNLIRQSLKNGKDGWHWETLVGFTLQDLIKHLEGQFKPGMNWSNYGKWHIDHRKPISSFKFNSYKDLEFKQCWALDNLQPLWALENLSKGNKVI